MIWDYNQNSFKETPVYNYPHYMTPFQHRPVARPTTQFVSGLIPLTSVISTIQQGGYIQPATAAPAALPVGWLIALGGAFIAYQYAKTKETLALGVAIAMLAGEAAYEILYAIGNPTTAVSSSSATS
jgi:hypothetical protein